jgi:hypothetical protein
MKGFHARPFASFAVDAFAFRLCVIAQVDALFAVKRHRVVPLVVFFRPSVGHPRKS